MDVPSASPPARAHLMAGPSVSGRETCDCCGQDTLTLGGWLLEDGAVVAGYRFQLTVGASLAEHPANLDLVVGPWGEGTGPEQRVAVSSLDFERDGTPHIRLIDATGRPHDAPHIAATAVRRAEVLGTPLATRTFALIDAVFLTDERIGSPREPDPGPA